MQQQKHQTFLTLQNVFVKISDKTRERQGNNGKAGLSPSNEYNDNIGGAAGNNCQFKSNRQACRKEQNQNPNSMFGEGRGR